MDLDNKDNKDNKMEFNILTLTFKKVQIQQI